MQVSKNTYTQDTIATIKYSRLHYEIGKVQGEIIIAHTKVHELKQMTTLLPNPSCRLNQHKIANQINPNSKEFKKKETNTISTGRSIVGHKSILTIFYLQLVPPSHQTWKSSILECSNQKSRTISFTTNNWFHIRLKDFFFIWRSYNKIGAIRVLYIIHDFIRQKLIP